jgi:5-methylcytosine-specific restriction endonuclease McrA
MPSARWRKEHPEEARAASARYRAAHPEEIKAASARWQKAHPERVKAENARYYAAHPEQKAAHARWRKAHTEEIKAYGALWRKAHPEQNAVRKSTRQARKLGNGVGDSVLMAAFRRRVAKALRIKCYWCREWIPKGHRHVDHITPLAKGGPDAELNLCCSCDLCNLSKGAKNPGEFSGQFELVLL